MNKVPDFTLPDQTGTMHSIGDYAGRWLVLYFYPEDDTPGCTAEACAFRDDLALLTKKGLAVVGVSKDSVASHVKFAEKYHLNFPLLSDESKGVMEAYGAWGLKKMWGKEYMGTTRKTFLINPAGEIAKEYPKVNPIGHSATILKDFEKLV
ncbi:MAG: thioredoxin-dependent thiol peroxidase [Candidatus Saccharimonadales bacterium]